MTIHKRVEELKVQGYSRERAKQILKKEFPNYHEHYYSDVTSDMESTAKVKKTRPEKPPQKVQVVGINMKFGEMVEFMIKWAFAAIPAAIIIGIIVLFFLMIIGMLSL